MRNALLASILLYVLAGCGDDGKTAPRGAPAAPPTAGVGDPASGGPLPEPAPVRDPAAPSSPPRTPTSSWASTRPGDWATWEVRAVGSEVVTRVTWRATLVDALGVRYRAQARTLDVDGTALSSVESDEVRPLGGRGTGDATAAWDDDAAAPAGVEETTTVAGARIVSTRRMRRDASGEVTVWTAAEVPFSGLVRSTSPVVTQTLVAFGRGS